METNLDQWDVHGISFAHLKSWDTGRDMSLVHSNSGMKNKAPCDISSTWITTLIFHISSSLTQILICTLTVLIERISNLFFPIHPQCPAKMEYPHEGPTANLHHKQFRSSILHVGGWTAGCPSFCSSSRQKDVCRMLAGWSCWIPLQKRQTISEICGNLQQERAAGAAWVLAPPKPADPSQMAEPDGDSVWSKVENPTLRSNPDIYNIIWVTLDPVRWVSVFGLKHKTT